MVTSAPLAMSTWALSTMPRSGSTLGVMKVIMISMIDGIWKITCSLVIVLLLFMMMVIMITWKRALAVNEWERIMMMMVVMVLLLFMMMAIMIIWERALAVQEWERRENILGW